MPLFRIAELSGRMMAQEVGQCVLSRRDILLQAAALGLSACIPARAAETGSADELQKEIALSFDDAPMADSLRMSGRARTDMLIAALDRADARGAMIFAVGGNVLKEGPERLHAYAEAGHTIANHTHTHPSANRMSAEEFLSDVGRADEVLRSMPGFRPFFRFPYLDAGDTVEKRDALRAGLRRMGYRHGYITADSRDWHISGQVDAALAHGRNVDWDVVGRAYVDVIARSAAFYDGVARRWLGRPVRHVMLLHENDLAALFIGDVCVRLRDEGWRIIPAERAFDDPIASREPDTLYLSGGQVSALANEAGAPVLSLQPGHTNMAALDALLAPAIGAQ